jgi:hypothetical protein
MGWLTGFLAFIGGSERKDFFLEKKKQKTFARLDPRWSDRRGAKVQKFFGSFFQKRTTLLSRVWPTSFPINQGE